MIRSSWKIIFVLFLLFATNSNAQKFGFGCFGLSGFYVGISEHHYKAEGINKYVNSNYGVSFSKLNDEVDFNLGSGYRIGANIFRVKWDNLFFTAKGFFQFLKEEHTQNISSLERNKLILNMNQWGIGIDVGMPITSFVDWKIVEGGITYYNSELVRQQLENNSLTIERKYAPEKNNASFYVATGIILHIIHDYMSLEATASYNFMNVNEFISKVSDSSTIKITDPFSEKGYSGTIQLNISFPF